MADSVRVDAIKRAALASAARRSPASTSPSHAASYHSHHHHHHHGADASEIRSATPPYNPRHLTRERDVAPLARFASAPVSDSDLHTSAMGSAGSALASALTSGVSAGAAAAGPVPAFHAFGSSTIIEDDLAAEHSTEPHRPSARPKRSSHVPATFHPRLVPADDPVLAPTTSDQGPPRRSSLTVVGHHLTPLPEDTIAATAAHLPVTSPLAEAGNGHGHVGPAAAAAAAAAAAKRAERAKSAPSPPTDGPQWGTRRDSSSSSRGSPRAGAAHAAASGAAARAGAGAGSGGGGSPTARGRRELRVPPVPIDTTGLRRAASMPIQSKRASLSLSRDGNQNKDNPYRRAITMLRALKLSAAAAGGEATVSNDVIDYLTTFVETAAAANADPAAVQYFMRQRFTSVPDVHDPHVQDYIIHSYTPKGQSLKREASFSLNTLKAVHAETPRKTHRGSFGLAPLLATLDEWSFDIFKVSELDPSNVLRNVVFRIFEEHALLVRFNIDDIVLSNFLTAVERGYYSNPYHNSMHGADVTHGMHYFLSRGGMQAFLSDQMTLSALLAACIHDLGHLGVNNPFLVSTGHPLALQYNDASPLENMHAATGFQIMQREHHNILAHLEPTEAKSVRAAVIGMVLSTDNAVHAKVLGGLKTLVAAMSGDDGHSESASITDPANLQVVLNNALHAADVSNPAKPWSLYEAWTDRIMEEFYAQGDRERDLRMPVTPMLDRTKPIPRPNFQAGFINAIVKPVYDTFGSVPGVNVGVCSTQLEVNLTRWKDEIAAAAAAKEAAEGGAASSA